MEEFAKSYQENPETIVEYLRFSKNFSSVFTREYCSHLSANPHATFVKSFVGWEKEGVIVNRGVKGIANWYAVQSTLLKRGTRFWRCPLPWRMPQKKKRI